jgi:uncharacterized protein YcgI (DUF1989 family)
MGPKMYAYTPGGLKVDEPFYQRLANTADTTRRRLREGIRVPMRTGRAWPVQKGQICRVVAVEGAQVGDFNVWNLHNPRERFWAARTRLLQRAHVTTFDRLWSCLPYLRPMLTFTNDTLSHERTVNGARCHDLLGSRCDPYLYKLVDDREFSVTCHNNLTHDPLNIFQVTGLDADDHYFAEKCPATRGDFLEFFAEIDLLCAISACPGGDLSIPPRGPHRGDPLPTCKALGVEIYDIEPGLLEGWTSPDPVTIGSAYERGSGGQGE